MHEGFKVKVNTWMGTQQRRGRTTVLSGVKLTWAAERGVQDAEKYVESLRSHCDKAKKQHDFNDIVLVEHAS